MNHFLSSLSVALFAAVAFSSCVSAGPRPVAGYLQPKKQIGDKLWELDKAREAGLVSDKEYRSYATLWYRSLLEKKQITYAQYLEECSHLKALPPVSKNGASGKK
ncbi:MAG: hypothetical protein RLZZ399_549 [Verrucomicrobiota bacterium]